MASFMPRAAVRAGRLHLLVGERESRPASEAGEGVMAPTVRAGCDRQPGTASGSPPGVCSVPPEGSQQVNRASPSDSAGRLFLDPQPDSGFAAARNASLSLTSLLLGTSSPFGALPSGTENAERAALAAEGGSFA